MISLVVLTLMLGRNMLEKTYWTPKNATQPPIFIAAQVRTVFTAYAFQKGLVGFLLLSPSV